MESGTQMLNIITCHPALPENPGPVPQRTVPWAFASQVITTGNLKEALVSAARVLILEKGPHGFSLIEAARLADVSPAAPYRHFKDRVALLAEVAQRGYDLFGEKLERAWQNGKPDRVTAFKRLGHAYLDFAQTERAYYAAMFQAGLSAASDPGLQEAADRAYQAMASVTADLTGNDGSLSVPPDVIFFHIWSLAHGAATLRPGDRETTPALSAHQMLDMGVELYLKGLGVTPLTLADAGILAFPADLWPTRRVFRFLTLKLL